VTTSIDVADVYDSNLFVAASHPMSDVITRITPSIEAQHASPLMTWSGRYTADLERFAAHRELTSVDARQSGGVELDYRPSRRLTVGADAAFTRTHTPGELNSSIGLAVTRALAERVQVHPSIVRRSETTRAGVDYTFTQDDLFGGARLRAHAVTMTLDHDLSARASTTVGYTVQQFDFGSAPATTSQALTVGVTHHMTRAVNLEVRGGPRVTDGSLAPDLSASLQTHTRPADFALAYTRTTATLIGLTGIVETQNVSATATCRVGRRLEMRFGPSLVHASRGDLQSRGYRLTAQASRAMTSRLSLVAAYNGGLQHGNVYPTIGDVIARHVLSVRLALTPAAPR
jgi:hypothetical protein